MLGAAVLRCTWNPPPEFQLKKQKRTMHVLRMQELCGRADAARLRGRTRLGHLITSLFQPQEFPTSCTVPRAPLPTRLLFQHQMTLHAVN